MITAVESIDANRPFTWPTRRPLLTAEWRHLAMLNYAVDRAILQPLVPPGTELDDWNGESYASVIGFQFLRTTFCGVPIPFHASFVEVNLRFYIRRRAPEGWRRGVAFIRELAPSRSVALVANLLYGERYLAVPMTHELVPGDGEVPRRLEYGWRYRGGSGRLTLEPTGEALPLAEGSHEQYIAEHYWGYSHHPRGGVEYEVAHPSWRYSPGRAASFECDHVAAVYGEPWVEALSGLPTSAFWADGSADRNASTNLPATEGLICSSRKATPSGMMCGRPATPYAASTRAAWRSGYLLLLAHQSPITSHQSPA